MQRVFRNTGVEIFHAMGSCQSDVKEETLLQVPLRKQNSVENRQYYAASFSRAILKALKRRGNHNDVCFSWYPSEFGPLGSTITNAQIQEEIKKILETFNIHATISVS